MDHSRWPSSRPSDGDQRGVNGLHSSGSRTFSRLANLPDSSRQSTVRAGKKFALDKYSCLVPCEEAILEVLPEGHINSSRKVCKGIPFIVALTPHAHGHRRLTDSRHR